MRKLLVTGFLVLTAFSSGAEESGIQRQDMDLAVRPAQDLFAYANGTWIRDTPIPDDRSSYGVDSMMLGSSLLHQRDLAEKARSASDPTARLVGNFYASFLDEKGPERAGLTPLRSELQHIGKVRKAAELAPLMAHLDLMGIDTPLSTYVSPDLKDSGHYAFWISQDGLGLPDRDYYLSDEPAMATVRTRYLDHVETLLGLAGEKNPHEKAASVLALESKIAAIEWKALDRRDPKKTYNPSTLDQLKTLAPAIDWAAYVKAQKLPTPLPVIVARQPDYLANLSKLMTETPLEDWKAYLKLRLISGAAPYLAQGFADEAFRFDKGVLQGVERKPERWKQALETIDRLAGEALGKLYVEAYFPIANKTRATALVGKLLEAYSDSITHSPWMGPETQKEALAKLNRITVKVGFPDHWRDYSALVIRPDDLLGNVLRAQSFEVLRKRAQLAGPVDRSEWEMTTPTVDAYYAGSTNEIVLPAGILQPPLYDPDADDAYNYGSTGATIGHEISHGFDNRGSQYDSHGNLRDWWSEEDRQKYNVIADRLVRQFDGFEPIPGYKINGKLTLPENIADLAGLEIAYKAYHISLGGHEAPVIDGLTGDQRFFIGYAQSNKVKRRDALQISQLKNNPHSPEKFRVNGVVPNLQAFDDAFGVTMQDKLYLPVEERAVFW